MGGPLRRLCVSFDISLLSGERWMGVRHFSAIRSALFVFRIDSFSFLPPRLEGEESMQGMGGAIRFRLLWWGRCFNFFLSLGA